MGLESSTARAEQMARHLIGHDRLIPAEELIESVEKVGVDDVKAFASRLVSGAPSVVVVGSGRKSKSEATRLADMIGAKA